MNNVQRELYQKGMQLQNNLQFCINSLQNDLHQLLDDGYININQLKTQLLTTDTDFANVISKLIIYRSEVKDLLSNIIAEHTRKPLE